ncbi:MAG: hypothetical protein NTV34_08590, partial [Proteobacteria bacterium]|nr:hypothetical protein [Pseudomonadota bacterium]
MHTSALLLNDRIMMLGYSEANMPDPQQSKKRFGYNRISDLSSNDRGDITTQIGKSFEGVALDHGDSGGPLFKNCEVAGIASRGEVDVDEITKVKTKLTSIHTNTTHTLNIEFLKASEQGYFCGITGNAEMYCPASQKFGVNS